MMITPFRSRFNDIFDELDSALSMAPTTGTSLRGQEMPAIAMAMDLTETDKEFKIKADLPGVEKKNVTIDALRDNTLLIKAERGKVKEEKDEKMHYHKIERSYGSVQRSVKLPETADLSATTAKMDNGVLEIAVAKRTVADKAKRIKIT
uniref:SHSP domain-containing protein n=1 Tax=Aureoumbra lagunensis TaxID=44058 RepID=A0A7S3NJQ6_9STRA